MRQIYRMYIDYMGWSLDFTGCQMVMTQKARHLSPRMHWLTAKHVTNTWPRLALHWPARAATRLCCYCEVLARGRPELCAATRDSRWESG